MATESSPFGFDAEKIKEMFQITKMPMLDVDAVLAAGQKNMDAMVEANKVVMAGYQDVYARQIALVEAAVSEAKDKFSATQPQALSVEQATQSIESMKAAFEKAATDVKELADLAQKANTSAFEIVKARAEEAVAEFKTAAENVAV